MSGDDWTIEDVAGLLRDRKDGFKKCCLLIGAGVSRSAGIDTGLEFIELIRKELETEYGRAQRKAGDRPPTYGECMVEVSEADRSALVREQIEAAEINWAHIGIARLEAAECVDRILTTNFDPLASRACALFNRFPAVYDLAALRDSDATSEHARYVPSLVSGSAIYHLHGQHTGFLLLNTEGLLEQQAQRIEPVLGDAMDGRVVIVCGYSGENDPLVERLRQSNFPQGLIWVRYDTEDPCQTVREMLERFPDAHVVRNMSADRFFTDLANALDLDQPAFLTQPFQHMLQVLGKIRPFSDISAGGVDLLEQARALLTGAAERSRSESPDQQTIADLMAQECYQAILDRFAPNVDRRSESERQLVAWAWIMVGNGLLNKARVKSGAEADALFAQAGERYAAALAIKPKMPEAFYNWGLALADQARTKAGAEADALFAQAGEKYAAALAAKPDKHEALSNWGNLLGDQAQTKSGGEADALFGQAGEKYAAALAIRPDKHDALNNWGNVLVGQAGSKSGAEADALFGQAGEKYAAALAIRPDKHEALNNWGLALADQARTKSGAAADALFGQAGEKYAAATAIKPDLHEAFNNWGNALGDQARTESGAAADALFGQAGEKYAAALAIRPDKHEALNNWGLTLADQARTKSGAEADALFGQAGEKYAAALAIKPDKHETLYAWGSALADQARTKSGVEADALFAQASEKYAAALAVKPDLHEAFNNWGITLADQARTKSGAAADVLFGQAGEKYAAALAIRPDMHEALSNWGLALAGQAGTKAGDEAEALLAQAGEKYAAALAIEPDQHETIYNWGLALAGQARTRSGAEADALYAQAGEKYAATLAIKSDLYEVLDNWGSALLSRVATQSGARREALLAEAEQKFNQARTISPTVGGYNLACIAALRGEPKQAAQWLRAARGDNNFPDCAHIRADGDFQEIRGHPEFVQALKDIGC